MLSVFKRLRKKKDPATEERTVDIAKDLKTQNLVPVDYHNTYDVSVILDNPELYAKDQLMHLNIDAKNYNALFYWLDSLFSANDTYKEKQFLHNLSVIEHMHGNIKAEILGVASELKDVTNMWKEVSKMFDEELNGEERKVS